MTDPIRGSSDAGDGAPLLPFVRPNPPLGAVLPDAGAPDAAPVIEDPYLVQMERDRALVRRREKLWRGLLAASVILMLLSAPAALLYLRHVDGPSTPPNANTQPPNTQPPNALPPSALVPSVVEPPPREPPPLPSATSSSSSSSGALTAAPRETRVTQVGRIQVVDLGVEDQRSLEESLRAERAAAQAGGRVLLVMTVQYKNTAFHDLDVALADPLLQEALGNVRLVRVDAAHYETELEGLGVPTDVIPWIVLLGPDLVPRDGITGGEWDDDIARNMAPVLGPFVRGTLKKRRVQWKPPRSKGVQL